MTPGRATTTRLCVLAIAASLVTSIFVSGATQPPGQFLKYLDAAARPHIPADRRLDYSPLYLDLVRFLAPSDGTSVERAKPVLTVQCVLLACACGAATFYLCAAWGSAAGLIGLLLMTTYRPFIVYAGVLEPESLIVSLLALAALCSMLVRRPERVPFWCALIAGSVILGLCAILRPTFLPLIPVWAVWIASIAKTARAWKATAAVGLSLLVITPTVVGHYRESGSPIFMDPGPAFYEGNGPLATGLTAADPELVGRLEAMQPAGNADYLHVGYRRIAAAELGHPVSAGESNRYWMGLALESMRSFAAAAFSRNCLKVAFAISPYEAHDLINAEDFDRQLRKILPWGFSVILVGLPFALLLDRRDWAMLAGPVTIGILVIAVQLLFYASARQRLPLALPGIMAVAAGASQITRRHSSFVARPLGLSVAGLGIFFALAWVTSPAQWQLETELRAFFGSPAVPERSLLSDILDGRALRPEARKAAILALDGRARYLSGQFAESLSTMEPVTSGTLSGSRTSRKDAFYWSARASLALGDVPRAKQSSRQAMSVLPQDVRSRALWLALNWKDESVSEARSWRPPGVDSVSARIALARELSYAGRRDLAVQLASGLAAQFPELAAKPWP